MAKHYSRKAPELPQHGLDFERSRQELTISEFENLHGNTLPVIVQVTRGGKVDGLELTKGQVITFQAVSKQERVVARALDWGYPELYSFPNGLHHSYTVVGRDGKATGSDTSLYSLLQGAKLPVRVQFSSGTVLQHGNKKLEASQLPQLELLYQYEETHILSNMVVYDTAKEDIIYVPMHESDLRVAMVTGIKGKTAADFSKFKEKVDHDCLRNEYDLQYGRLDVAVYDLPHMRSRRINRCTKPTRLTDFAELFDRPRLETSEADIPMPDDEDTDGNYVPMDELHINVAPSPPVAPKPKNWKSATGTGNETEKQKQTDSSNTNDAAKQGGTAQYTNNIPRGQATPFQLAAKTAGVSKTVRSSPNSGVGNQVLPKEQSGNTVMSQSDKGKVVLPQRSSGKPAMSQTGRGKLVQAKSSAEQNTGSLDRHDGATGKELKDSGKQTNKQVDISGLTIDEVIKYLDMLNLGHYADKFRKQMVDGRILEDLNESIITSDFKMTRVESIRLMKFVREGHIPR